MILMLKVVVSILVIFGLSCLAGAVIAWAGSDDEPT